ncbi:MAG: acyl-CoA dehydrogenase family protein, partial [Ilumatobacteraceae bacterium]
MTTPLAAPDLVAASDAVGLADQAVATASRRLTAAGGPDVEQVLAYDLAHAASAVATAKALLDYGAKGDVEARITCAFVADVVHDLVSKLVGREQLWGVDPASLSAAHDFVVAYRDPDFVGALADQAGPRHLSDDMEMVQDTFRSFAANVVAPHAE